MTIQATNVYTLGLQSLLTGGFSLTGNFQALFLNGSYTPNPATDSTYSNVSGFELSTGGGYTNGGIAVSGMAASVVGNVISFTTNPVNFSSFSAGPFRYVAFCHMAGGSLVPGDLLLFFDDVTGGGVVTGNGGPASFTPNSGGWFQITHNP